VAAAFLTVAIICEVVGTTFLTYSDWLLEAGAEPRHRCRLRALLRAAGPSAKDHGGSVVYAIWSGVGTALIVIGITVLGESINLIKDAGIALIIVGVAELHPHRGALTRSRPSPSVMITVD
jgi:small multidrug resistance pump